MRDDTTRGAEQAHRKVQQMDARCGHRAGRRILCRKAPIVRRQVQELVLTEICLDLQRQTQRALGEEPGGRRTIGELVLHAVQVHQEPDPERRIL
jgi:hypothetical protein